ncbi:MAG: DUF5309 family protein [Verrucomicrobia bacterium]|nr:DUF5309 family protein [Verrucomicrobiota bacterium]
MPATPITTVKGQREDLSDAMVLIEPGDTPLFSLAKKNPEPTNVLFQWPADRYSDPQTAGVLANDDVSSFDDEHANRELLSGRIQKIRRSFQVDDLVENVADLAGVGRKKAFAKAGAKALVELKIDIEAIMGSDNDSAVQSGSTPYRTRGIGSWISATAQADTATAVPAAFRTPAASINTTATGSLTESGVIDVLESIFKVRRARRNYDLVCGTSLKRAFTNFIRTQTGSSSVMSTVRTFNSNVENKKIVNTIDIYEGDFGVLSLHVSTYLANGAAAAVSAARGYVLDMDLVSIGFNRKPRMEELEDRGGGRRGFVDAIFGVAVANPSVLGKFAATT